MADLNYKAEDSVYKVKEIGGYMELELPRKESYYYGADVVDVNGNRIDDIRPKELITEAVEKAERGDDS